MCGEQCRAHCKCYLSVSKNYFAFLQIHHLPPALFLHIKKKRHVGDNRILICLWKNLLDI